MIQYIHLYAHTLIHAPVLGSPFSFPIVLLYGLTDVLGVLVMVFTWAAGKVKSGHAMHDFLL